MVCLDNFFTGSRANVAHLFANPMFELMRHDVTMPLYVEALFNDYDWVGAFTVSALLAMLALLTLVLKSLLEWRYADELAAVHRH